MNRDRRKFSDSMAGGELWEIRTAGQAVPVRFRRKGTDTSTRLAALRQFLLLRHLGDHRSETTKGAGLSRTATTIRRRKEWEPAKESPRRKRSVRLRRRTERRHSSAGASFPPSRGSWPRRPSRHLRLENMPGDLRSRNCKEASRTGMKISTARCGETPRSSIRRVPGR